MYRGIERLAIERLPDPDPAADEVVIRVRACGICGSDLHAFRSGAHTRPGQVMGHEFAGEVVAVGSDVLGVSPGQRATASPIIPCGTCPRCVEGRLNLCVTAWTAGIAYGRPGAFAEYVTVPHAVLGETLFTVPAQLGDESAAFAEPLAVAVHAVGIAAPAAGATSVVVGLGAVGQLVVRALRALGRGEIVGVDVSRLRREAAAAAGARIVDGSAELGDALDAELGGREVDVVFECSGVPALVHSALKRVRPGGRVVCLALYGDRVALHPSLLVSRELSLLGSIAYTPQDFRVALALLASGAIDPSALITHRRPLPRIDEAFAVQLRKDESIKVMVTP